MAIGLFAIALVIILAITGIMLNHTEAFKLDERYIKASWLLDWYGIKPEDEPVAVTASAAPRVSLQTALQRGQVARHANEAAPHIAPHH